MLRRSPRWYKRAFAVVFFLLVGTGIASYVTSDRFANSEEMVIHTHEVIADLRSLSLEVTEAESARRGYVLVADKALLIDYDLALQVIPGHLKHLGSLVADNPRQAQRVSELEPLIAERMALLTQSIQLQQQDPLAQDQQKEFTSRGAVLENKIQTLLGAMEEEERQLLRFRSSISTRKQHRATGILVLTFLLASMVLVSLFLVMNSEVVQRAQAEMLAKENEEKYRLLVAGIQDHAIIRIDLEGRIVTWNQGAHRLFGYTPLEILGASFFRLYHSCESDTPKRHLSTAFDKGQVTDECEQVRKDGSVFWATANLTLLRSEEGEPRGYAVITRDITERRLHREEIQQREAQLNAFFSNAPVGLAILDKNLCFQKINRPFAEINGLDPGDRIGEPVGKVVTHMASQIEPLLRRVAQTGEPILNQEIRGPMPASPSVTGWWLKSFFPVTREGSEVTQIGAIVQDVTGLKRAEISVRSLSGRLLQIRDEERRRLARDLHDSVGQILSAIKMNLSYLSRDTSSLDERGSTAVLESKALVEDALKEVRTLSHLLHPPMLDEVGLAPAIRWYADGFARRSGIKVDLDLPADLRRLSSEFEMAMFRVVQESLTNIHRHSGSTTATIRLQAQKDAIHLHVSDDGHGISPDKLALWPEGGVLGVGILGMRERLRQLSGQLEISSGSHGTSVHAVIPLSEAA